MKTYSSKRFFVIQNNTRSSRGTEVTWIYANAIIKLALDDLRRRGDALEDLAGVPFIEDEDGNFNPARALSDDEILHLSIDVVRENETLYKLFNTDESGAAEFLSEAESHGLYDEAIVIVNNHIS